MRSSCFFAAGLVALFLGGAAVGARAVWAEEGLRLAGSRPRLFVPEARLPEIVKRARGGLQGIYEGRVKKDCDAPLDDRRLRFTLANTHYLLPRVLALLVCARIERAAAYEEKALVIIRAVLDDDDGHGKSTGKRDARIRLQTLAIAYDWLHDRLRPDDRERLRAALSERCQRLAGALAAEDELVSGHSHFTTATLLIAYLALAEGGGSSADEHGVLAARALRHWQGYVEVARYVGADGGHHLGWRYGRSYATRLAWVSEAVATATGAEVFEAERPWLSQLGYHLLYGLRPDGTYFRIGDTHRRIAVNLEEDFLAAAILAARYGDPHLAWLASSILDRCQESRAYAADAHYVWPLLFHDPGAPRAAPGDLPPVRAFRLAGNYVLRSSWKPDATVVLFRAMPWYHFNHERRDFSSFLLYHQGALAVHGGAYLTGDDESDYGGPHLTNYAWRTVAHNTVTVYDPSERFCKPTGPRRERCEGENRLANDGGQRLRTTFDDESPVPHFQPRNRAEIDDPRFAQGRVLVFEDRPELTSIVADATPAYSARKLELFERHLFFLKQVAGWKQPVVAVLDRVVAKDPAFRKTWNLHTVAVPDVSGRLATVVNTTRVRLAGDTQPAERDPYAQYAGKLYLETLLPADARLEFVGGSGREFWVDGVNYAADIGEADQVVEPGIGRIEVTPGAPRAADLFLHLLFPCGAGESAPRPRSGLLAGNAGAAFQVGDFVIVVRLSAARGAVRYRVDDDSARTHVLTRMRPSSRHVVRRAGREAQRAESSAQGVIVFTAADGGELEVEVEGE